ncbi:MAG: amino acid adenylation domain-containing protein, partial [bacterium]|nr:amino acid adenylation domain-containing protein [bacterium]
MVDMHHIISDGISNEILKKDFAALYRGKQLAPLEIQYKDYSEWRKSKKERKNRERQEKHWLETFAGEIPVLQLPVDYPRPEMQRFEGDHYSIEIDALRTGELKQLALESGTTLYMVLLSIFNILLARLTGQEDIIVGTPVAGRRHADLYDIIGMFVNTLPLRNYPGIRKTYGQFLNEVKGTTLAAFDNQEYPFEELVGKVSPKRDTRRNPLFDVMFNHNNVRESTGEETPGEREPGNQPGDQHKHAQDETTGKETRTIPQTAKFDITLTTMQINRNLYLSIQYATSLFKSRTIPRFVAYFEKILTAVTQNPEVKLSQIELIQDEEKRRILYEFNDTEAQYAANKTIHRIFEEQVEKAPDRIALVMEGTPGKRKNPGNTSAYPLYMTYRELEERAGGLAETLYAKNIKSGKIVCIIMDRSFEMVIAILAVLKAGAAYLPVIPGYPAERTAFILEDSNAALVLTTTAAKNELETKQEVLYLDQTAERPRRRGNRPGTGRHSKKMLTSSAAAYIIYTSGSTGTPKGVVVAHRPVVNLLTGQVRDYPLKATGAWLLKTTYMFDVSVPELFGWMQEGARMVLLEPGGEKEPLTIIEIIGRQGITHINFVPSMFMQFVNSLEPDNIKKLTPLKYIFLAGEELLPGPVKQFMKFETGIRLENLYGPTEATVYAAGYSLTAWKGSGKIPIGKPLTNVKLYILNKGNRMQPMGLTGELVISGAGLASGYLNNPELTAEKFPPAADLFNPYEKETQAPPNMMLPHSPIPKNQPQITGNQPSLPTNQYPITDNSFYRTGDLARW